jgi:hypothetical protein
MASVTTRIDKQGRKKYDVRIRIRGHAIKTGTSTPPRTPASSLVTIIYAVFAPSPIFPQGCMGS